MKILFTCSREPNIFSQMIAQIEGSEWTHVLVETDLCLPGTSDPLCFQSSWSGGFSLVPKSIIVGNKIVKEYEDGIPLNWAFVRTLMSQFSGFYSYGWPQAAGKLLRAFKIKEPGWLVSRYSKSAYCSKLILLLWAKAKYPCALDLNTSGPGDLQKFLEAKRSVR